MYISIHPSSPYATCILSQQNTSTNDARTRYYNIYGSTPKVEINGNLVPVSANYGDSSIFNGQKNLTGPLSMRMQQYKYGQDSIKIRVTVVKHDLSSAKPLLFIGLAEDTVFVNGGNGEPEHYNVLRSALTIVEGEALGNLVNVGDSVVVERTAGFQGIWDANRVFGFALVQDSASKQLLQSVNSTPKTNDLNTGINNITSTPLFNIYPNPSSSSVTVTSAVNGNLHLQLRNLYGQVLKDITLNHTTEIDISNLAQGMYLLWAIDNKNNPWVKVITKL